MSEFLKHTKTATEEKNLGNLSKPREKMDSSDIIMFWRIGSWVLHMIVFGFLNVTRT